MQARFVYEGGLTTDRALSATQVLYDRVAEADSPAVVLFGAELTGKAVVLGSYQRLADAIIRDEAHTSGYEILRRATGGPSTVAGDGIFYFAIALRHASALMECPPDRLLNRNVRGVVSSLSAMEVKAQYVGQEWLSVGRKPAGLVGWDRAPDGRVLIEFFLALDRPFTPPSDLVAYPKRKNPPFKGAKPTVLHEAWGSETSADEVAQWLRRGHMDTYELQLSEVPLSDEENERAQQEATGFFATANSEADLRWSKPVEVPIGFVSAGVTLDAEQQIDQVALAGDFFQDREAVRVLGEKLVGQRPSEQVYSDAVEATYGPTSRTIEGLSGLDVLKERLLAAAPAPDQEEGE